MTGKSRPDVIYAVLDKLGGNVGDTIGIKADVVNNGSDGDVRLFYGLGFTIDDMIYLVDSATRDTFMKAGESVTFDVSHKITQAEYDRQEGTGYLYQPTPLRLFILSGHQETYKDPWVWDDSYSIVFVIREGEPQTGIIESIWDLITGGDDETPTMPDPTPVMDYSGNEIAAPFITASYVTGFEFYNASKGYYVRVSGQAYYRNYAECPNWKTKCTYSCFGTFKAESGGAKWSDAAIVEKCIDMSFGRSEAVIISDAFYDSYGPEIDVYLAKNPAKMVFIGHPTNTGSGCGDLIYDRLSSVETPTDTEADPETSENYIDGRLIIVAAVIIGYSIISMIKK